MIILQERCLSFFVYLSGPFELARVLVEKKDNASFDLYHEIKGNLFKGYRYSHLVLPNRVDICGFLISISQMRQISVLIGEKSS